MEEDRSFRESAIKLASTVSSFDWKTRRRVVALPLFNSLLFHYYYYKYMHILLITVQGKWAWYYIYIYIIHMHIYTHCLYMCLQNVWLKSHLIRLWTSDSLYVENIFLILWEYYYYISLHIYVRRTTIYMCLIDVILNWIQSIHLVRIIEFSEDDLCCERQGFAVIITNN